MPVIDLVFNQIVAKAEELLESRAKEPPPKVIEKKLQQIELDKFFSKPRFCEHHDAARELVHILTGYKPEEVKAPKVPFFSILRCKQNNDCWILFPCEQGFARLDGSNRINQAGCESIPTIEEARAFLENFKKLDPKLFFDWCDSKLSSTDWMFNL